MGWVTAGTSVQDVNKTTNQNTSAYGTNSPVLSQDWLDAFKKSQGNLNGSGATGTQQQAVDWASNNLASNPAMAALYDANNNLQPIKTQLGDVQSQWAPFTTQAARQLGQTQQSAYAGDVNAQTGARDMGAYADPFLKDVVGTSVSDYNTNVDRTLNGIRAGRDASGAFGDRSAVADAQYQGDATRGLGSLVSGLYSQGFNTAAGLGQQDASRNLLGQQSNQATTQQNNQFNAGLLDSAAKFNVNAGYQGDQQKMQALQGVTDNLTKQAGLTQEQANNVVTANGINTDAAQALFQAGTITQEQLNQIIQLAQAGNGSSYTANQDTHATSNEVTAKASAGFGKV